MRNLQSQYFDWICEVVSGEYSPEHTPGLRDLLYTLDQIDFNYVIDMDGNREADGIDLRYRFGNENGVDIGLITNELDCRPCSVLEMLVALAFRCEEQFMGDPEIGDQTGRWFWDMIESMGLIPMRYRRFANRDLIRQTVNRFMYREYNPDGTNGNIFIIKNHRDIRSVEIWTQLCWHLDNLLRKEDY